MTVERSDDLKRLHDLLARIGPATAQELAELLWFARFLPRPLDPPSAQPAQTPPDVKEQSPDASTEPRSRQSAQEREPAARADRIELYPPTTSQTTGTVGAGVSVSAPPMLTRTLQIQRALRALKRDVPSAHLPRVLDEEATTALLAERRRAGAGQPGLPWLPVMVPACERWLSLALVADSGPSMRIWEPLVWELRETLFQLGGFRDVRLWWLAGSDSATAIRTSPDGAALRPSSLVDPAGRQAVLVLSDCSGPHWWSGAVGPTLHCWAASGPTAILQPLAERMWRRTAAQPTVGRIWAGRAAVPNTALRFTPHGGVPKRRPGSIANPRPRSIPVPLVELSPSWLADWSRLITASVGHGQPAAVTYVEAEAEPEPRDQILAADRELTIAHRVLRFQSAATPQAAALAAYLAAFAPAVLLPVMHLIQRRMVPGSGPTALAEVLLSGLLRASEQNRDQYEFVPGARGALSRTLPRSRVLAAAEVFREISAEIDNLAGSATRVFDARVQVNERGAVAVSGRGTDPFAAVGPDTLRRMTSVRTDAFIAETGAPDTSINRPAGEAAPIALDAVRDGPPRTADHVTTRATHLPTSQDSAAEPPRAQVTVSADDSFRVPAARLGLWGAPESGKTTFLTALFLAASQLVRRGGRESPITVRALDRASEEFKLRHTMMLAVERRFPVATVAASPLLEWRFTGDLRGTRFVPRRLLGAGRSVPLDFVLRMRDTPGEYFGREPATDQLDLVGELAQCDGLIYLLDPGREAFHHDSYAYFEAVSTQLLRRVGEEGRLVDGRLPHQLAVCITKFDDPRTFAESKFTGLVRLHPDTGQPYIPAESARRYFDAMCVATRGTAEAVRDAIRTNFLPQRTHYYAVSSIGFVGDNSLWGMEDPSNRVRTLDGNFGLRYRPRPINVLEPVVDLERALRA